MAGPDDPRALRAPVVPDLAGEPPAAPAAAPPVPEPFAAGAATVLAAPGPRGPLAGRLFLWATTGFLSLVIGIAVTDFVAALLARNAVLAALVGGLAGLALLGALAMVWGEWRAWRRLAAVEGLRARAEDAAVAGDLAAAQGAVADVRRLYAGRAEMADALARHQARAGEVMDADAALALAEDMILAGPDAEARRAVEAAARQVAAATALIPLALADVAVALVANVRMIRRIAEVYGGRAGTFGSWRLLRRVFGHLAATGALAVGDDLISSVAGGGVVSRLSRRFGEGVMNGALTARVGVAAMEVCRPLPFRSAARPRIPALLGRALTGLFGTGGG
ncbi:MAG: TIGR01620 family protein [Gemmobacter sp.]